jgi:hypothetical protein
MACRAFGFSAFSPFALCYTGDVGDNTLVGLFVAATMSNSRLDCIEFASRREDFNM